MPYQAFLIVSSQGLVTRRRFSKHGFASCIVDPAEPRVRSIFEPAILEHVLGWLRSGCILGVLLEPDFVPDFVHGLPPVPLPLPLVLPLPLG